MVFFQVNLQIFGKSPIDLYNIDPYVTEFRVYINKREGLVNTFMLNGGRPHIIVPGLDPQKKLQKPQTFHYVIK